MLTSSEKNNERRRQLTLTSLLKKVKKNSVCYGENDSNYINIQSLKNNKRQAALSNITNIVSKREKEEESLKSLSKVDNKTSVYLANDILKSNNNRSSSQNDSLQLSAETLAKLQSGYFSCSCTQTAAEKLELYDPLYNREYFEEIMEYLCDLEKKERPDTRYMDKQQNVDVQMRTILIDWLVEVVAEYNLTTQSLHLAVNYIDRFMSRRNVARETLQLLGVTALLVAAKFEEVSPPSINDLVYITDNTYTKAQIIELEKLLLQTLNFQLGFPTSQTHAARLLRLVPFEGSAHEFSLFQALVHYFLDLCLMDYTMVKYLPSQTAVCAVMLALLCMEKDVWAHVLHFYQKSNVSFLFECLSDMQKVYTNSRNSKCHQAVHAKFSLPFYNKVGLLELKFPFISNS
jgi:hypothetical protein